MAMSELQTSPEMPVENTPMALDALKFPNVTLEPSTPDMEEPTAGRSAHTTITTDPAATPTAQATPTKAPQELLVVSPYTTPAHLLDPTTVAPAHALLARALSLMQPVRDDYATAPYGEAFAWPAVVYRLRHLLKQAAHADGFRWTDAVTFYVVVFRSRLPPSTDRTRLGMLDQAAHAEATASGGLLKYWFGVPDAEGRSLATCIWRDTSDAKRGGSGPGHRQAMRETRSLYLEWRIEQLALTIGPDAATWEIAEWK